MVAGALLLSAVAVRAADIQLGSLRLAWPEGFTQRKQTPPFELAGPEGQKILVSVMRSKTDQTGEPNPEEQEKLTSFGESFMAKQAAQFGKVVAPLVRSRLAAGSVVAHVVSEDSGLFGKGYFVQFMVVAPSGRLAFFTIEGKGSALEQHARFLPIISSAEWAP
ncbi:MAG: hypothetical protein LW854_22005 [Rubrivivax sp.]|jgi:hypothetical protein|nr:hypothetical protein [Rubrivivax sp.]